jgi:hypothetical protein
MGVAPTVEVKVTTYPDGCLWGSARVVTDDWTREGAWRYPNSMSTYDIITCLDRWVTGICNGVRDGELLYGYATDSIGPWGT